MSNANGAFHEETSPATALIVPPYAHSLAIQRAPEVVLEEATRAAQALAKVIESKPKKVVLNGKTYLQFEDWQTLGRFYGVTAVAKSTRYVEYGEGEYAVRGWEATADALLVGNNQVISSAEAMCLNDEPKWNMRPVYQYNENGERTQVGEEAVPLFQLRSMAQTRACAKALRNVLAWVVVLAGYAPTPAEEMDGVGVSAQDSGIGLPRRKSVASTKTAKPATSGPDTRKISEAQDNRLWAIARQSTVLKTEVNELIQHFGFANTRDITRDKYQQICARLAELGGE